MNGQWRDRLTLGTLVAGIGLVTVVAARVAATGQVGELDGAALGRLGLFVVAIALGEMARVTILTGRETAPMSTAAALALATSGLTTGGSPVGVAVVISTISLGMVAGVLLLGLTSVRRRWEETLARLAGAAVAPLLYRAVPFDGQPLVEWQHEWDDRRWLVAVVMLLVGGLAMLVDLTLEAIVRAGRDGAPLLPSIADEYRSTAGLATALAVSGALISLGEYALGALALPLFLFPLALTYFAVQRFASIRRTYRQTIGALSSLTDVAGYTTAGHGDRVAALAVPVGRELGLSARELTDLEYAALLHDLGQVSLRDPIPAGATVMAATADQQRIAVDGAEIVRSTGVLDQVATILEAQATPYRQVREFGQDLPMPSRIIKVANAYDDIAGPGERDHERAMERIHLGLGYEYDPRVVDSLTRVLARRGRPTP